LPQSPGAAIFTNTAFCTLSIVQPNGLGYGEVISWFSMAFNKQVPHAKR